MAVSDQNAAASLSEDEIEQTFGRYWVPAPRRDVDQAIRLLAEGDECRQADILAAMGKTRGGTNSRIFKALLSAGLVETVDAQIRSGRKTQMLRLTERGQALAAALGLQPRNGLPELLKRHRSPKQALLVLQAQDVLIRWNYRVDLWPNRFRTPLGRDCRPDIVARPPWNQTLFVEVEVRPYWARSANTYPPARVTKWAIFHEVNGGCLYVLTPTPRRERALVHETLMWHQITGEAVTLFSANVTYPGSKWDRHIFP